MKAVVIAGLTTIRSGFGSAETTNRVEKAVREKGLTIFSRIDHAAGAADIGLPLRPTTLFIFGNARGGTPLMQAEQTAGIDLPLKVLVWDDADNKTWISYNEPSWITQRHGLTNVDSVVNKITALLRSITTQAASNQ